MWGVSITAYSVDLSASRAGGCSAAATVRMRHSDFFSAQRGLRKRHGDGPFGGKTGVTHLFNAMRQITPREPEIVGTVLSSGDYCAGIIADDHRVHLMNWSLAVQTMPDHLWLVSDAMQTMNGSSQDMKLYGTRLLYRTGVCWERMAHLVAHT